MTVRLTHVQCNGGGAGVSRLGHCAVIVSFDLAADREVESLRVLELTGPWRQIELRLLLPGLDENHNPRRMPFDGSVGTGGTLRLEAIADLAAMTGGLPEGSRYLMTLSTGAAGERFELGGPAGGSWATAGPARTH